MSELRVWGPLRNGKYWQMKWVTPEGVIRTKSLGAMAKLSRARARAVVIDYASRLRSDSQAIEHKAMTFRDLGERMEAAYSSAATGTIRLQDTVMRSLVEFFGAGARIDAISRTRADEWEASVSRRLGIRGKPLSEFTIRRYNAIAKKFCNWAIDRGYLSRNPFKALKSGPLRVDKEVPYITDATFRQLVKHAGVRAKQHPILLQLCRWAGLRLNECFPDRLPWTAIDFERRIINLKGKDRHGTRKRSTKHGARTIPIRPELYDALLAAYESAPVGSSGPCDNLSYDRCGRNTRAAIRRAGVVWNGDPHHSLRASCERDWVDAGHSIPDIARAMGHDPKVMMMHYLRDSEKFFTAISRDPNKEAGIDLGKDKPQNFPNPSPKKSKARKTP